MPDTQNTVRHFKVHALHIDRRHTRLINETSFEAAAVAYVQDFDLPAPIDDDHEISIIVQEIPTGREHCFRINLDSGEAAPCG